MAKPRTDVQLRPKREPLLWLLILAAVGMLLSAYMVWARAAHAPTYCPLGAGCDVVQSSRYAAVFGLPVALLGLLFYTALFVLAARPMESGHRLAYAVPIGFGGVGASVVFTVVQRVAIQATCSLCLASAALTLVILILLLAARPGRAGWRIWGWSAAAATVAVVFLVAGYAASTPQSAEQTYAEGLAKHLATTGVKFYGAYWCPHCTDQKKMFGEAVSLLPYIECDQRSPVGQPAVCAAAGIRAFPTWDINGKRYEGVLSLEQLADLTRYPPPP